MCLLFSFNQSFKYTFVFPLNKFWQDLWYYHGFVLLCVLALFIIFINFRFELLTSWCEMSAGSGLCSCSRDLEKSYQRERLSPREMCPRSVYHQNSIEDGFYIETIQDFNSLPLVMSSKVFISYKVFSSLIIHLYFSQT